MTTPTSSTTTLSPPMAFLHANPVSVVVATINSNNIDAAEREARQRAIQKFLARAEISKVSWNRLHWLGGVVRVESSYDPCIFVYVARQRHG
jgi:hypothetical protein